MKSITSQGVAYDPKTYQERGRSTVRYFFDENRALLYTMGADSAGTCTGKTEFTYNKKRQIVLEMSHKGCQLAPSNTFAYEYKSDGKNQAIWITPTDTANYPHVRVKKVLNRKNQVIESYAYTRAGWYFLDVYEYNADGRPQKINALTDAFSSQTGKPYSLIAAITIQYPRLDPQGNPLHIVLLDKKGEKIGERYLQYEYFPKD